MKLIFFITLVFSSLSVFTQVELSNYMSDYLSNLERVDSTTVKGIKFQKRSYKLKPGQLKTLQKTISINNEFYNLVSKKSKALVVLKYPEIDKEFEGVLARMFSFEGTDKIVGDSVIFSYDTVEKQYKKSLYSDSVKIEIKSEFIYLNNTLAHEWFDRNFRVKEGLTKTSFGYVIPQGFQDRAPLYIILSMNMVILTNNNEYFEPAYQRIGKTIQKLADESLLAFGFGKMDTIKTVITKKLFQIESVVGEPVRSHSYKIKKKLLVETRVYAN